MHPSQPADPPPAVVRAPAPTRRSTLRRRTAFALPVVAVVALVGCGSGDDAPAGHDPTTTSSTTAPHSSSTTPVIVNPPPPTTGTAPTIPLNPPISRPAP